MKPLHRVFFSLTTAAVLGAVSLPTNAQSATAPEPNSVDALVTLAEQVKVQDPGRYAVMKPEVDRIVARQRLATAGLVGLIAGGVMAAYGGSAAGADQDRCDETTADASYDRADCYDDAVDDNARYVYVGGGLAVAGLVTYLIARPSSEEILEAARNAPWSPGAVRVGVNLSREGQGAVAVVNGHF